MVAAVTEKKGLAIRGVVGSIKWGYYTAAAINGYKVTRKDKSWYLRGNVVDADAFKMSQRPLLFVAPTDKGDWVWPIEAFDIQNGKLTARLRAPKER